MWDLFIFASGARKNKQIPHFITLLHNCRALKVPNSSENQN
jgi:hypothetical protein